MYGLADTNPGGIMLTELNRDLDALKHRLIAATGGLTPGDIGALNMAVAHVNDAAAILGTLATRLEPDRAALDHQALADRQELEQLRAQMDALRAGDKPRPAAVVEPIEGQTTVEDYLAVPAQADTAPFNPDATTTDLEAAQADLIKPVEGAPDAVPMGDPAAVAAEQALVSGRRADEDSRQSDVDRPVSELNS